MDVVMGEFVTVIADGELQIGGVRWVSRESPMANPNDIWFDVNLRHSRRRYQESDQGLTWIHGRHVDDVDGEALLAAHKLRT